MKKALIMLTITALLSGCGPDDSSDNGGVLPPSPDDGSSLPVPPPPPDDGSSLPVPPPPPPAIYYKAISQSSRGGKVSPDSLSLESGKQGSFTVVADAGFVLDSISGCNGKFSGSASEGNFTTGAMVADCTVKANFISNSANAIRKRDHSLASADELIVHARAAIARSEVERKARVNQIYGDIDRLTWYPSHDSITFTSTKPDTAMTLLPSNVDHHGNPAVRGLVMISEQDNYRSAAMGANMFAQNVNNETVLLLKGLINWLTKDQDKSDGLVVVTSHMPSGGWFPHNEGIRNWLNTYYAGNHTINAVNSCDYSDLSRCIDTLKPDLIVISDNDSKALGYDGIATSVAKAKAAGIPILLSNYNRYASAFLLPLYQDMGVVTYGNYFSKLQVKDLDVAEIKRQDADFNAADILLENLGSGNFTTAFVENCNGNYLNCNEPQFLKNFKNGANWLRYALIGHDAAATDVLSLKGSDVLKAALLLADKYRQSIDYPIEWAEDQVWQQTLLADWLVNYARPDNLPQPDLGEYVTQRKNVAKGSNANYLYPSTHSERKTISVPFTDQWTTTGWYVLPGQTITLTRHDNSPTAAVVKLHYARDKTNRVFEEKVYRSPIELTTQRLSLPAGGSVTFSSPYGAPLYLHLNGGGEGKLSVDVTAKGITPHPTVTDFNDLSQLDRFNQLMTQTELPHVDLRNDGAEQHLRRDKFENAIGGAVPNINALLKSIAEDHIDTVYTLAGLKLAGKTLKESLPADVISACNNLFGEQCFDESLHTIRIIQHANYDENAQCGGGCAGNPWDASWNINPIGWGDNHELGHNMQVNRLNVQYASAANADHWPGYGSRAGENSNNIFPYQVKWRAHYVRDGETTPIRDTHMNHKDLFYVFMSDAAKVTDAAGNRVVLGGNCKKLDVGDSRYEAAWASNSYNAHGSYRMAFYIQMALRAHGMVLADGTRLTNGFNIFTLLYQHHRIFGALSGNASDWNNKKGSLGFGLFPFKDHSVYGGRQVKEIPGNDFMLVSLSKLTGRNWQSHFDLFGLRYSSLAAQQAQSNANATSGSDSGNLPMGMYVLETELPPANMSEGLIFLPLAVDDATTKWHDNSSPLNCSSV